MSFEPHIDLYGRWSFIVDSESRPGLRHIVDLEPELNDQGDIAHGGEPWKCSCEAHQFKVTRPCKHVTEVLRFLKPIIKFLKAFPGEPVSLSEKKTTPKKYQLDASKKYDPAKPNKTAP